jgi:hypothetical protein
VGLLINRSNGKHATLRVQNPRARTEDLIIEEVEGEVLVYDSKEKRAHCLGATAARVWRACDGSLGTDALADHLELSSAEVRDALDELDSCELLETSGLNVVQSNGEGKGLTRRQLTMRSAKVGAGLVTAPLVYSINVSSALAVITPTPFQCEVYTVKSCGTSDACGHIAGCCCCCQGGGSCKTCGATAFCNAGTQPCSPVQGGGFGSHCSSVGSTPADARGCCGISGSQNCNCGFGPFADCCNQNTGTICTPPGGTVSAANAADTNCFPCCNGVKLTSSAALGCCVSATVNCCAAGAPSCCAKSTLKTDCCGANPPACCATNSCP